ncbi:MAG: aspartate carbamoyltransferase, partial [Deltaproteobacteria bacterium]
MARHLIDTTDLSIQEIQTLFAQAKKFLMRPASNSLQDKLIMTCFFENSTRTRMSFESASLRLGAKLVSLNAQTSSINKNETTLDTVLNLDAMMPDAIIVRHQTSGIAKELSTHINASLINAGDGTNAHPTQSLLDLFTLLQAFDSKDLSGKTIAIAGDIAHSRVANSNMELLSRFGANIILVAPQYFMPKQNKFDKSNSFEPIINDLDVIISLRAQLERHKDTFEQTNLTITKTLLGERDIKILHPG